MIAICKNPPLTLKLEGKLVWTENAPFINGSVISLSRSVTVKPHPASDDVKPDALGTKMDVESIRSENASKIHLLPKPLSIENYRRLLGRSCSSQIN